MPVSWTLTEQSGSGPYLVAKGFDIDEKPSHGSHVVVDGGKDPDAEAALSVGASSPARDEERQPPGAILTPDQRVRVFISSTLEELAAERVAARRAIERLHLVPVWYESGARPHPPRSMYRAYLAQSQIFVGIYWQRYGWVAPGMDISGLEDEYRLAEAKPMLLYLKRPAPGLEPRLSAMIDSIREAGTVSYRTFATARELERLLADDLAVLLSERFVDAAAGAEAPPAGHDQPAGSELSAGRTLSFLFTDIEGSTALLRRLGDGYVAVLADHHRLIRAAIAEYGGHEVDTQGDAFFVAFGGATQAVLCALQIQRALAAHRWPAGAPVRVRIGVHTGQAVQAGEEYVGLDVHRAARIAAAAHGGQVLISEATRLLAESRLPAGVSLRDLGWHRLKDIEAAERIYQLVVPGLAERFPPLKSLGALSRLPVPLTPLVGRERDLEQLLVALSRPGARLVTLTGTGGVGKTRLALAAAASLDQVRPHGVFFVALAAVRDAEVMWKAIADDLDVRGDGPAADAVTGYLGDRQPLLVLDNLEQLDGAAGVVAGLLAAAPRLVVLATSRRPLHVQGEQELPVPPLQVPPDAGSVEQVAACSAAQLFVQQAALVRPGFSLTADNAADIAAICGRLDGLPLAIELAASRASLLAPRALLARLGRRLDLAAVGVGQPSRQQTLRATISWSYELLTPELARVFRRMGVFAGGCDLDALAAVAGPGLGAGPDPLELGAGLHDVSLITVTDGADSEPRVGMLETIREYALERLEQDGDLDDARRGHAQYYAGVAERAYEQLHGSGPAHLAALDRLEAEHDNLRAALAWSLETPAAGPEPGGGERAATGLRLVQALARFWYRRGYFAEGRHWLERAIELTAEDGGAPLAHSALWLGLLLQFQGEFDAAVPLFERSRAISRDLGDREREARALNSLASIYHHLGDLDVARSLLEDSIGIARQAGGGFPLRAALTSLGQTESDAGNFDRATQVLQEALELDRKENDLYSIAVAQQSLAEVSLCAGRPGEARDLLSGMVDYVVSSGDPGFLATTLELSAAITAELGDGLRTARLAGAAEAIRQKLGTPIPPADETRLERYLGPARAAIAPEAWHAELAAGRALTQQQAASLLVSPFPAHDTRQ